MAEPLRALLPDAVSRHTGAGILLRSSNSCCMYHFLSVRAPGQLCLGFWRPSKGVSMAVCCAG